MNDTTATPAGRLLADADLRWPLGPCLRSALRRKGFATIREAAAAIGIHEGQLARYCRGEATPSHRTAAKVHVATGIDWLSLYEERG